MNYVFDNQLANIYLIGVMISVGIIKDKEYFSDIYTLIISYIKSKRLIVTLISLLSGILPIPGRVIISAGVLSTIAPTEEENHKSRHKFGIIDFITTHHYYLWSPLEKTVIIPMSVLGLSYMEMLHYTSGLIVLSLMFILWYIFINLKESDIVINHRKDDIDISRIIYGLVPFIISIALLIMNSNYHYLIFSVLAMYYIIVSKTFSINKINSYINWALVLLLICIIIIANLIHSSYDDIEILLLKLGFLDIQTSAGFIVISLIAYGTSFLLGSSGKYAGIVALLCSLYGTQYLTWFMALEFSGYLVSPTHKCTHIGRMYFGTRMRKYYEVLLLWSILLISYAYLDIKLL